MTDNHSDQDVRALLELAGRRAEPPADARARVYSAVEAAWEETPARKREDASTRRWPLLAVAASVVIAAFVGYRALAPVPAPAPEYAGEIVFAAGGYSVRGSGADHSVQIRPGSMVRTSAEGKLLIALGPDSSMRMDGNTSATLHGSDEIWLHAGRIYVDDRSGASQIRIVTPLASITDIGTQFEVSVDDDNLSVAVREGEIDVAFGAGSTRAAAGEGRGEVVRFEGADEIERFSVSTTDERWSWIHGAAPEFDPKGKSVAEFLEWMSRESGLSLRYVNDVVRMQAMNNPTPEGPIGDFGPEEAISIVLDTAELVRVEGQPHELVINRSR